MTLRNITQLDTVHLPESMDVPTDHPVWPFLEPDVRSLLTTTVDVAQKARALAVSYCELRAEAEVLRAERDALLALLNRRPVTSH